MNEAAYTQFALQVYGPAATASGGVVMAFLLVLLLIMTMRDLVNFDKESKPNASGNANPNP